MRSQHKYKASRDEIITEYLTVINELNRRHTDWNAKHKDQIKRIICAKGMGFMLGLDNTLKPRLSNDHFYRLDLDYVDLDLDVAINRLAVQVNPRVALHDRYQYRVTFTRAFACAVLNGAAGTQYSASGMGLDQEMVGIVKEFMASEFPVLDSITSFQRACLHESVSSTTVHEYLRSLQDRWVEFVRSHPSKHKLKEDWFSCKIRRSIIGVNIRLGCDRTGDFAHALGMKCAHEVFRIIREYKETMPISEPTKRSRPDTGSFVQPPLTRQRTESEDKNENAGVCAQAIKVFEEALNPNVEEKQAWIDDVLRNCDGFEKGAVTVENCLSINHVVKTQRIVDATISLMRLMRYDQKRKKLLGMNLVEKLGMLLIRITVRDTHPYFEKSQWKRMANIDLRWATKLFFRVRREEDTQAHFAVVALKGLCSFVGEHPDEYGYTEPILKMLANAASLSDITLEYKDRIHAEARKAIDYCHKFDPQITKVILDNTLRKLSDQRERAGLQEWLRQFEITN